MYILQIFFFCFSERFFVHVVERVRRNQVIVTVRNFVSDKPSTYSSASRCFLDGWREFFRGLENSRIIWFWNFWKMIDLDLWYYENMSKLDRENIQKCVRIFIFIYFKRRDFSWDDFRKKSGHLYFLIKSIKYISYSWILNPDYPNADSDILYFFLDSFSYIRNNLTTTSTIKFWRYIYFWNILMSEWIFFIWHTCKS